MPVMTIALVFVSNSCNYALIKKKRGPHLATPNVNLNKHERRLSYLNGSDENGSDDNTDQPVSEDLVLYTFGFVFIGMMIIMGLFAAIELCIQSYSSILAQFSAAIGGDLSFLKARSSQIPQDDVDGLTFVMKAKTLVSLLLAIISMLFGIGKDLAYRPEEAESAYTQINMKYVTYSRLEIALP